MTSEAQIAANRRNAQASTGPRTSEGKARVRRNAVTHGLCAETTPDQGEDRDAFADLYRSLIHTYAPINVEEQAQVARIASLQWRLSRVPAAENAVHARVEQRLAANDEDATEDLPALWAAALCDPETQRAQTALQRYEAHLARQLNAAHAMFQTLRKTLRASHPPIVYLSEDPEWAEESEYAYAKDACGGEAWTTNGLMPAFGLAKRRDPTNDPIDDDLLDDVAGPHEAEQTLTLHPAVPAEAAEPQRPEEDRESDPSRRTPSYPPGHQDFGDPLRQRPKMTREEVAAWRPPGDNPKPGNYGYPDGRMRYWPGEDGEDVGSA